MICFPYPADFVQKNPEEWQWTLLAQCMQTSVDQLRKVYFKQALQQKSADYVWLLNTFPPQRG